MKNRKRGSEDFLSSSYNEYDENGKGISSRRQRVASGYKPVPAGTGYPETITAFADGLKSDFIDMFSTGANVLGSTVKMFFPMHNIDETTEDSLNDIEVKTPAGSKAPQKENYKNSTRPAPSPLKKKFKETEEAIRMRCSNLWHEADKSGESSSSNNMKGLDDATHGGGRIAVRPQQTRKNSAKGQKGGKVLLAKLAKSPSIQHFSCGEDNDRIVILGNLRMIHCVKNNDEQNTATIIWCEKFHEIKSCSISCSVGKSSTSSEGKLESKLDITTRDDNMFSVALGDATLCIQVMQIIQQRCLPPSTRMDGDNSVEAGLETKGTGTISQQSVDLLGLESFTSRRDGADLEPLAIGPSPKKLSTRRLVNNKRHSAKKLIVNIKKDVPKNCDRNENTSINPLPPPPLKLETNLIDFEENNQESSSPAKKARLMNGTAIAKVDQQRGSEIKNLHNPSSNDLSSKPPHLVKYTSMLKTGVPKDAVKQKMIMDGMSAHDISGICSQNIEVPKIEETEINLSSPSESDSLKKYKTMLKTGIPQNAVRQKMMLEGVTTEDMNKVLGIQNEVIPSNLKKFQAMLKSGVPQGAVQQKMELEGISPQDQALIFGKKNAPSSTAPPTTPKNKGPQLLGLHWEPLAENTGSLSKSMWGDIHSSDVDSSDLHEKEFDTLSTMFSRKATPAKQLDSSQTKTCGNTSDRILRSKSKMPTSIDMSRSNNISIGMSSFKQKKLTTDDIVRAINNLDTSVLNCEDLSRLLEIMPSDSEKKIFNRSTSAEKIEQFHDTEKWLYRMSTIDNCKGKIDAMVFMCSFLLNADISVGKIKALIDFTELVVSSSALKEVMKCILAIGNSLNKGTYKGGAKGFRLGSLLKLQQTKSTDGKNTVMDYLIQVLHSRYVNGDLKAGGALTLNDELSQVSNVMNINANDIKQEVSVMKRQFVNLKNVFEKIYGEKDSNLLIDTNFENNSAKTFIESFISEAEEKVLILQDLQKSLQIDCDRVIVFFGEEQGSSVQQMYSQLGEFIDGFSRSKKKFEDNLRKESRLKAAAASKKRKKVEE